MQDSTEVTLLCYKQANPRRSSARRDSLVQTSCPTMAGGLGMRVRGLVYSLLQEPSSLRQIMGVDISQKTLIRAAKVREHRFNFCSCCSLPRDHKSIYLFLHTLQMRQCPIPFQHCSQAHLILQEHMLHCWFFTNGTPLRLGQSNSICKSRIKWPANIVALTKNAGTAEDPDNTEAWSQLSIGKFAKTHSLWGFYNRYGPTAPCSWCGHLHWGTSVSIHCISILHSHLEVTEADALVLQHFVTNAGFRMF